MRKGKSIFSFILAFIIFFQPVLLEANISIVKAEGNQEVKTYLIMTKDKNSYNRIRSRNRSYLELEEGNPYVLEEANIMLMNFTESQAEQVQQDNSILYIEEDILLTADSFSQAVPVTGGGITPTPEPEQPLPETTSTPEPEQPLPETTPTPEPEQPLPEVTPTPEPEQPLPEITPIPEEPL